MICLVHCACQELCQSVAACKGYSWRSGDTSHIHYHKCFLVSRVGVGNKLNTEFTSARCSSPVCVQPASQPASQSASQPARQQASQTARQPVRQPTRQSASRQAGRQVPVHAQIQSTDLLRPTEGGFFDGALFFPEDEHRFLQEISFFQRKNISGEEDYREEDFARKH